MINMRQTGRVRNIRCLIGVELFLKTACLSFFVPIINKMFYLCLWAAGYSYITKENLWNFFLSPLTLFSLVLLVAIGVLILRMEWCAVRHAVECGQSGRKLSFSELFFESFAQIPTFGKKKPEAATKQQERTSICYREAVGTILKKGIVLFVVETVLYVVILAGVIWLTVRMIPERISGVFLLRVYERYHFFSICIFLSVNLVVIEYICAGIGCAGRRKRVEHKRKRIGEKKRIYLWFSFIAMLVFATTQFVAFFRNRSVVLSEALEQVCITAHRGASGTAPENTLSAIGLAVKEGADYAEIDIRMTKDKVPVLLHDASLERTTDGAQKIGTVTYQELCGYEITESHETEGYFERVPRLKDVFSGYGGKIGFNIELKETDSPELVEVVLELMEEYGVEKSCVITSTSLSQLELIKQKNREIKTGLILSFVLGDFYKSTAVDFFSIRGEFISEQVVKRAHASGKEVHAWTINDEYEIRRLIAVGVDNIITDKPAYTREILQESKGKKSIEGWISLFASKNAE